MTDPDLPAVIDYFSRLQQRICACIEALDGTATFASHHTDHPNGGLSRACILEDGPHMERGAVNLSHSIGDALPAAATERNPQLAGRSFQAAAISLIMHPRNPYVPTMHANLRCFAVEDTHWHFGGGFDLTPCYPFMEDVLHWHRTARAACDPFGADLYPAMKRACDDYFYLPHRQETRGIGGLFFDDWNKDGFAASFALVRSIGDHILPAYKPIMRRRMHTAHGERERDFQLYRRGRYVEFNLVIDRGTKYGLQSGRRIENVLASMPPHARWKYDWQPRPGTPEAALYSDYLKPRDWLAEAPSASAPS